MFWCILSIFVLTWCFWSFHHRDLLQLAARGGFFNLALVTLAAKGRDFQLPWKEKHFKFRKRTSFQHETVMGMPVVLWLLLMFFIFDSLETLEVTKWCVLLLRIAGIRLHAAISQLARENHPSRPASATIILHSVGLSVLSPNLPMVTGLVRRGAWFSSSNVWQSDFQRQQQAFERQRARTSKKEVIKAVLTWHTYWILLTHWPPRIACQVGSNKVVARAELVTCIYMGHYVNGRFSASGAVHQMFGVWVWHEGNETIATLEEHTARVIGCIYTCSY